MYWFDSTFIILIPALIIAAWAQLNIKSTYATYSRVKNRNNYTGSDVARMILDNYGLYNVKIEPIAGTLTDHFDPRDNVVRLSKDIFYGNSISAIGVAAHEVGHAIQYSENYTPMQIRGALVPVANIGSSASWFLLVIGLIFGLRPLATFGVILFSAVVLFQLVTLPVEFNASMRAVKILDSRRILYDDEVKGAKKVLKAAAMTYVAAAITAISQLLRLIAISNRD